MSSHLALFGLLLTTIQGPDQGPALDAPVQVIPTHDLGSFKSVARRAITLADDPLPGFVAVRTDPGLVIALHRNLGDGAFEQAWTSELVSAVAFAGGVFPKFRSFVEVGDLDGDGDQDVAIAFGLSLARVYVEGQSAVVEVDPPWTAGTNFLGLAVADFDGDGIDDIALAKPTSVELQLSSGGVVEHFHAAHVWGEPIEAYDLRADDLDGDGDPDLALATTVRVQWLELKQAAQVVGYHAPVEHGLGAVMMDTGDVDGDGDADAVLFSHDGQYRVWRNGPGGFGLEGAALGGPAEYLRDVDGDGDLDGVCCSGGGGGPTKEYTVASRFEIALGDGSGGFEPAFSIPGQGSLQLAGVDDFDGDGDPDLLAGVMLYRGQGAFGPTEPTVSPADFAAVRATDVDGDGDLDVDGGLSSVLLNQGGGNFVATAPSVSASPIGTSFVGPGFRGDWDGDGDADLLVEHRGQGDQLIGMRLLANAGGGHLADAGAAGPPGSSFALDSLELPRGMARDLDQDGDLDLLVSATLPTYATALWANDGSGRFTLQQSLANFFPIEAAQLDGVPGLELVGLAESLGDPWLVFAQPDAGGTYQTVELFETGVGTVGEVRDAHDAALVVEDIDGDGRRDVAAAYFTYEAGQSILRNVSTSGVLAFEHSDFFDFSSPTPFSQSLETRLIALDADGDGRVDLVNGPLSLTGNLSAVVLNRSTPGALDFELAIQAVLPELVLDVETDGDPDLLGEYLAVSAATNSAESGAALQLGAPQPAPDGSWSTLGTVGDLNPAGIATLRVTGLPGGAPGLVAFATSALELDGTLLPGLTTWVDALSAPLATIPFVASGSLGEVGSGSFELDYQVAPGWVGLEFTKQAFAIDLSAGATITASNGLQLTYGN